jgi:hypothetical protein
MKKIALIIAVMITLPSAAFAADYIAGKIQGASYVFNKTVQPTGTDDPKVVLERDFVLQTTDGKAYFLPNVPRSMKTKAVNKEVRVYGDLNPNETIFVHQITMKYGKDFIPLCDWEKKAAENASN